MKRIVPGLLIAGFWLLLLLQGSLGLYSLVVVVIVLIGADEYVRMADSRPAGRLERIVLDLLLSLPVFVVCLWPDTGGGGVTGGFFLFILAIVAFFLRRYKDLNDPYGFFCRLILGGVYVGLLGAHMVLLRHLPQGGEWLAIATAITAASDSGAYFVGRAFGRHRLCPNISPKKTIEGALGGMVSALAAVLAVAPFLLSEVNWLSLVVCTLGLTVLGIIGDLTESIIKRGTGTKDSGTCLAGHGGILDRVDSLLFVGPGLYYLLILRVL